MSTINLDTFYSSVNFGLDARVIDDYLLWLGGVGWCSLSCLLWMCLPIQFSTADQFIWTCGDSYQRQGIHWVENPGGMDGGDGVGFYED